MSDEDWQDDMPTTVCGGRLLDPEEAPSTMYRGEKLLFCTAACLRVFREDPEAFLSGEVVHPLEDE